MQEHIRERVLTLSDYIIESGATVRQTASKYGISKSTVHIEVIIGDASFG
ncbi:MAG: sporulation transcriptional regulator SpoIIID [Firmicutes bacterium]|nr:sporulation transcriptional regulator SpoIIID [Bacillota bacterium]